MTLRETRWLLMILSYQIVVELYTEQAQNEAKNLNGDGEDSEGEDGMIQLVGEANRIHDPTLSLQS